MVQCGVVLVDKEIARRSPLNSAKPENFFLSSFQRAQIPDSSIQRAQKAPELSFQRAPENGTNSLSAIGETVNRSNLQKEQKGKNIEVSRGKEKEQDVKAMTNIDIELYQL